MVSATSPSSVLNSLFRTVRKDSLALIWSLSTFSLIKVFLAVVFVLFSSLEAASIRSNAALRCFSRSVRRLLVWAPKPVTNRQVNKTTSILFITYPENV
ncbi:MAG: hypothetical protein BWY72_00998 [Bacteroidetes bacterium ADurb.Bin416]|nr:MAG: hypothetical protein BWY72_00998 [Bacteroidetes bacterium ADurb.Bin416]